MTWADGVAIAIVMLSGLLALARGFVREVLGIGAWIGAGLAAFAFYPLIEPQLESFIHEQKLILPVSIGVIFVGALIVLLILSAWLGSMVRDSILAGVDRTLGFAFGLVRGAVIICLAYIGLSIFLQPPEWPKAITHARLLPYAQSGSEFLAAFLPRAYRPHVDNIRAANRTKRTPSLPPDTGTSQ